jgi:hypothetical protein
MSAEGAAPRIGLGRALAFLVTALPVSMAFYFIYGKFFGDTIPVGFIACALLCAALSYLFGLWGRGSSVWLKVGTAAFCLVMPFVAELTLILAACYLGPECM